MSGGSGPGAGPRGVHRGHVLHVAGRPTVETAAEALVSIPDGALVVGDAGTILWVGPHAALPRDFADWPVTGDAGAFLLPGFVDTHLHFPQTYSTDAFGGGQLLEWLDTAIFPAESRLADEEFASRIARAFTRRRVSAGTTAAMVFGSAFPHAQDALFERSVEAGLRTVSGRGLQTVGPPSAAALLTGEDEALALVAEEVDRWHAVDTGDPSTALQQVAIVPRFSLSVTPTTLAGLGELYDGVRDRGVYVHSHLNENDRPGDGEIAAVRASFGTRSYLDTYDGLFLPGSQRGGSSLLGRRTILAHAVHCQDEELHRMAATGTSIAHCPTSQQFLGSGTMPWRRTAAAGVTIALGSDIGAGDEWLLARVANDTFKVHLSEEGDASIALHPAQLLFTATLAGARALDMEERFGNFDLGKDADFLRIEPDRWEPLAEVLALGVRADDPEEATDQLLFALLLGLREPAIAAVHVQGRRVVAPSL
ncbi:amidohydrolase family protein [Rathayibacter sp. VKM Ac-2927]|uniref:amidohydrolase family protein n=1 Tax=Rathayibacter sp. VKM Ac-2927 TaxID=2929478 RepID=UPI001FB20E02|nr:amidohydrolase family protein [Rathayibacter sp. VKM Ac-2927]MCJ1687911.1 amidohydrolase family protein [Rathayibacter sp. VKM Ac-2927]